jgi:septum formation protein
MFKCEGELILASASPRRKDFLKGLGLDFTVEVADVPEEPLDGERPEDFVKRVSRDKAVSVGVTNPDAWLIGADTAVVLDKMIFGKPGNPDDALAMLTMLSGRSHEVWTGFTVSYGNQVKTTRAVRTWVRFIEADQKLLLAYIATGEPLDKAGAYGIQGKGGALVKRIDGSYTNVVGLPLAELTEELLALGAIVPAP